MRFSNQTSVRAAHPRLQVSGATALGCSSPSKSIRKTAPVRGEASHDLDNFCTRPGRIAISRLVKSLERRRCRFVPNMASVFGSANLVDCRAAIGEHRRSELEIASQTGADCWPKSLENLHRNARYDAPKLALISAHSVS